MKYLLIYQIQNLRMMSLFINIFSILNAKVDVREKTLIEFFYIMIIKVI